MVDVQPYRFDVLHTPGHTSSCISLADPERDVLISGDTLMAGGAMGGIFGSGNISDYILSLQRLERLGLGTTLPGHGRASATGKDDAAVAARRAKGFAAQHAGAVSLPVRDHRLRSHPRVLARPEPLISGMHAGWPAAHAKNDSHIRGRGQ